MWWCHGVLFILSLFPAIGSLDRLQSFERVLEMASNEKSSANLHDGVFGALKGKAGEDGRSGRTHDNFSPVRTGGSGRKGHKRNNSEGERAPATRSSKRLGHSPGSARAMGLPKRAKGQDAAVAEPAALAEVVAGHLLTGDVAMGAHPAEAGSTGAGLVGSDSGPGVY